jgi:hypothetical protein
MCCSQGTPTITRRPWSSARSSSQRWGAEYTRTALMPAAAICAKSRAAVSGSNPPEGSELKGP